MKITPFTAGMKITAPMIVSDMPNDFYHNQTPEFISKSGLDLFDRSPAHFYCAAPKEATRAMEIGTAFHTAILEPARFKEEYMILVDCNDRRQSQYKEAVNVYGSERVLVGSESESVIGATHALSLNPDYQAMQAEPHFIELSFFGQCPETGALIKCRFDYLSESGQAVDLKKTQDVRIDAFSRSILNYRYHVQHAFYSHVYKSVTGDPLQSFKFLTIEEKAPNSNRMYSLCEETKQIGHAEMMQNLRDYAANEDKTEGIAQEAEIISLPVWYLNNNSLEEIQ